jgi:peptide/nickel transport system substrate-binding protein/oligopeptide transport system substrate-binding protein
MLRTIRWSWLRAGQPRDQRNARARRGRGAGERRLAGVPAILLLALVALMAASCGSTSRPPTNQPAPDAQQMLRDALVTSATDSAGAPAIASYDPIQAHDPASTTLATLIYPSLVTLDSQLTVRLLAAESMSVSPDGKTITFALRSGMRFSDGEPITAQTFAFALNRALDPCNAAPLAWYLYPIANAAAFNQEACAAPAQDGIAGPITTLIGIGQPITVVDPLTLTLTLGQPSMRLLAALTQPIAFAVPQQLVQQYGAQWTSHLTDHNGFGGGLFLLKRSPTAGSVLLARNAAFWGAAPRLREIVYHLYSARDAAQAYSDYQAGKLDIGYPAAAQAVALPKSAGVQSTPLLRVVYLGLNWHIAPFNEQDMREAIAQAIDKQSIATQTLGGQVIATNHIVPQGMVGYNPALVGPDSSQALGGSTAAAVKLAQAFASSACSGAFATCPAITLEAPAEDPNASIVAADIAQMWQRVAPGYPLAVRIEPQAELQQREQSGAAQFYLDTWVAAYPDAQNALGRFTPSTPGVSGSVNVPDAKALLATADAEQDPTQRAKDYQAAEQLLVSAVAVIPLYQEQLHWLASARVQNVVFDPLGQMSVYDALPSVVIMQHA